MVTMDETLHAEISPGSIHTTQCNTCGNDALTFDVLALGNNGVGIIGTIHKCPQCNPSQ